MNTGDNASVVDPIASGLRAAFRIGSRWGLDDEQIVGMLGKPPAASLAKLKSGEVLQTPADLAERLGHVLGVFRALHTLYRHDRDADTWMHRQNDYALFGGSPPLQLMLTAGVDDLLRVRAHLEGLIQY